MASCLAERIGDMIELSPAERDALHALEQRERVLKKGAVLLRERDRAGDLFTVRDGMLMSHVLLADGSRQILRFLFPGDVVATWALAYRHSPETVVAVADSVVAPVDRAQLGALFSQHPRLAAAWVALGEVERVALTDRIASLGRTSAKARIAALLLECRDRLRSPEGSTGGAFVLRLTQEEIGDATGLTAVHVNRMLRQLDDEGLIRRAGSCITFLDERAVGQVAHYADRLDGLDLDWLSPVQDGTGG